METSDWNRLYLLVAFAANLAGTRVNLPDRAFDLVVFEAVGVTLGAAIPALIAQWLLKQPRVYHVWTLGWSLAFALLQYSGY
jgi:hypothetical protein